MLCTLLYNISQCCSWSFLKGS